MKLQAPRLQRDDLMLWIVLLLSCTGAPLQSIGEEGAGAPMTGNESIQLHLAQSDSDAESQIPKQ